MTTRVYYEKNTKERALAMNKALQEKFPANTLSWQPSEGGLYLWAYLNSGNSRTLLQEVSKDDVSFALGESFFSDGSGKRALRLCYSGTKPNQITEGVERLSNAFLRAMQQTDALGTRNFAVPVAKVPSTI